jgi:hypothetical protein
MRMLYIITILAGLKLVGSDLSTLQVWSSTPHVAL